MREIKFRVWHNDCMFVVDENSSYTLEFGNRKPMFGIFSNGGEFVESIPVDNVMQFTGLHDCEGREIWEGDILEARGDSRLRTKVLFKDGSFRGEFSSFSPVITKHYIETNRLKVIGNIHENPELLNES